MSMADVRLGLRAYLLADGSISSAVGGSRIHPIKLPQGQTTDSIVYTRISAQGDHHMEGASGLVRTRIQIDCYSLSANSAVTLANLVKERIDGFRGDMAWDENSPANAVTVQGIFFDSERESFDDLTKLYGVSRDYLVWFKELI